MDKKKPVGRPTKYKPEYCQQLIEHMALGLSYECFGAVIDVSLSTTQRWEGLHEEFSVAKIKGFHKSRLFYERLGRQALLGNIPNFNTTIWIFNMKNRFPNEWRDRHDVAIEIGDNKEDFALLKAMPRALLMEAVVVKKEDDDETE